jgi:CheY-like chemotaxis protein
MTTPLKTRILLADDHAVVRRGLKLVLDAEPDLEVVVEAGDGAEAVERAVSEDVHLAVLDVTMPRLTGIQAARALARRRARAAHADSLDVRPRALRVRGAPRRGVRLRAEVGRRPRPGRGLPSDDAGRVLPLSGVSSASWVDSR